MQIAFQFNSIQSIETQALPKCRFSADRSIPISSEMSGGQSQPFFLGAQ